MKLKKILLQLGLLLAFVGVGMIGVKTAEAAGGNPSGVDADATQLSGAAFSQERYSASQVPDDSDGVYGTGAYPIMPSGVYANGVVGGRVTINTTKIFVKFSISDSGSLPTVKNNGQLNSFYPDVSQSKQGISSSLVTKPVTSWPVSGSSVKSIPSSWTELDVDLSKLGNGITLPIYIGFSYRYNTNYTNRYYWVSLASDATALKNMADVTIDGANGSVASGTNVITGTAEPNLPVTLTGVDETDGPYKATTDSKGNYSINLGTDKLGNKRTLSSLKASSPITVTENNEFGDVKRATAKVIDTVPLSMTAATPTVGVSPDQLASLSGKSDSEVLQWLATTEAAGLTVTKQGDATALDNTKLTFSADKTGLAAGIAKATASSPLTLNVGAVDGDGDKTSSMTAINVYPTNGIFKFGILSDYDFGELPVPSRETLFAPKNEPSVPIQDTQTVGKGWRVTASATKMHDKADNTYLNGKLVYVDASGNLNDLTGTSSVQVGSGDRKAGQDSVEVASGWAKSGQTVDASKFAGGAANTSVTPGIYLDAQPNIYATSATTGSSYVGVLSWTLTNSAS